MNIFGAIIKVTMDKLISLIQTWWQFTGHWPVAGVMLLVMLILGIVGAIHVIRYDINKDVN
jgi:hypothetical protein